MTERCIKGEIVLPRRVVPQPVPHLHPGGDCGACVLGGLLGLTVAEVYDRFRDGKRDSFEHESMYSALWAARPELLDRIVTQAPIWPHLHESMATWGAPSWTQTLAWFAYLRMGLDAGYYAMGRVNHAKKGPWEAPDHWVMIVGARELYPPEGKGGAIDQQVLVSCSSKSTPDEEWVEVRDFLEHRGAFNLFLARPTQPKEG